MGQIVRRLLGPDLGLGVLIPLQAAASSAGVAGFALMFNGTRRIAVAAGFIGMVANVPRLVLLRLDVPPQAAATLAALLVGLMSAAVGSWLRVPGSP